MASVILDNRNPSGGVKASTPCPPDAPSSLLPILTSREIGRRARRLHDDDEEVILLYVACAPKSCCCRSVGGGSRVETKEGQACDVLFQLQLSIFEVECRSQ